MTPSFGMFLDNQPCTDRDFVSVADKDELKIEGYANTSFKLREIHLLLSSNKVAYVLKLRYILIHHRDRIIMSITDLMFKKRTGTYADLIKYKGDDTTQSPIVVTATQNIT